MTQLPRKDRTPLRRSALAGYGLLGLPAALAGGAMIVLVPTFYAEEFGVGLAVAGATLTLARIVELLIAPLAGLLSDRTRTPVGPRLPWILCGAAVLGAACYMLFIPGEGAGAVHLLLWSMVLYGGLTLLTIPYGAWGCEVSADYDERTRVAGAREFCAALAPLTIALIAFAGIDGMGARLSAIGWILIVILPAAVVALWWVPRTPSPVKQGRKDFKTSVALVIANEPFVKLLGASLFVALANGLPASLFVIYVDQVLGATASAGWLLAAFLGGAMIGIPIWVIVAGHLGKHRTWISAIIAGAAAYLCIPFIGSGDVWPFLGICIATGFVFGADLILPAAILADVVDKDHWHSGRQRAGLLFGLWSMTGKIGSAVALGLAFPLLAALGVAIGGRDSSAVGLLGLSALFGLGPVMFRAIALAILSDFRFHREQQVDLRRRLAGRARKQR